MVVQVLRTRGPMTEYDLMDIIEDDMENELGQVSTEFQRAVGVLLREGLIEEYGEEVRVGFKPDGRVFGPAF